MAVRENTMEHERILSIDRILNSLPGRILLVVLAAVAAAVVLPLLFQVSSFVSLALLRWVVVAIIGLVSGLVARGVFAARTPALRLWTALLALLAGLVMLGLTTQGAAGATLPAASQSELNWTWLVQYAFGALLAWLALNAARRQPQPAGGGRRKSPASRSQNARSTRGGATQGRTTRARTTSRPEPRPKARSSAARSGGSTGAARTTGQTGSPRAATAAASGRTESAPKPRPKSKSTVSSRSSASRLQLPFNPYINSNTPGLPARPKRSRSQSTRTQSGEARSGGRPASRHSAAEAAEGPSTNRRAAGRASNPPSEPRPSQSPADNSPARPRRSPDLSSSQPPTSRASVGSAQPVRPSRPPRPPVPTRSATPAASTRPLSRRLGTLNTRLQAWWHRGVPPPDALPNPGAPRSSAARLRLESSTPSTRRPVAWPSLKRRLDPPPAETGAPDRPAAPPLTVRLVGDEDFRCPFCLETVAEDDPRGIVECQICHTRHHADCWEITGACQVPHYNG